MKKILTKAGILLLVFILGVIGFSSLMNKETTDNKMDLEEATLPVMSMKIGGEKANLMYGHAGQMQVDFMRESLTPLETDKELTVSITPNGHKIKDLVYEVRTSDGSKVIENDKIKNFKKDGEDKTVTFSLRKSILMNQEYSLAFTLTTDEGEYYYYTRILQRSGLNTEKYLQFAKQFSEDTFDSDARSEIVSYLESDDSTRNNSFLDVNIHSSVSMVMWGDLNPSVLSEGIPVIKDINGTTGSVTLTYYITAEDDDKNQELYQVEEFYRMRYDGSKMYLLNFNRSTKQIFTGDSSSIANGRVNLGVTSKNVQYVANKTGEIFAFVQQGDIWSYNTATNKLVQVFSFRKQDAIQNFDARENISQHDFKIIRVEESGDIDFVVYGYMNRGEREGQTGTAVYHYYSDQNVLEEKVFIPSLSSYEFMKQDVQVLSYVSTDNMLYLYQQKKLYRINLSEKTYEVVKDGIDTQCFFTSNSNRHIAWLEEMKLFDSSNIIELDLETGEQKKITASDGTRIRAFGFINEDLVYGVADESDIKTDSTGSFYYAMNELRIQNFDGELVKSYAEDGVYITDVKISQGLIELSRAQWQNDHYAEITSDHIMNNVKTKEEEVASIATVTTTRQAGITRLVYSDENKNKNPLVSVPKWMVLEDSTTLELDEGTDDTNYYYVYANGGLYGIYTDVASAVQEADAQTGVVLNRAQQYVWERGNTKTKVTLNVDEIPDWFKSAKTDVSYLEEQLGDGGTVMNLTGCTLEEVLYQVSAQRPVIVSLGDAGNRVIVGYDAYNTLLYNPADQTTSYMGINDSTAAFEKAGNVFISYIEKKIE